jgi:hypothetical protein
MIGFVVFLTVLHGTFELVEAFQVSVHCTVHSGIHASRSKQQEAPQVLGGQKTPTS